MEFTCSGGELRHSCIQRNADLHRINRMDPGHGVAESHFPHEAKVRVCSCSSCQRTQHPLQCSHQLSTGDRGYVSSAVGAGYTECFNLRKDHPRTRSVCCCPAVYNAADVSGMASGVERSCVMCSSFNRPQQSSQNSDVDCMLTPPSELRALNFQRGSGADTCAVEAPFSLESMAAKPVKAGPSRPECTSPQDENVRSTAKGATHLATRALGKQIRVYNWYLVRPRGAHISEVAVGGFLSTGAEEKERIETEPIVERLDRCTLLAKDGVIVRLVRLIDDYTTISNGFSPEVANIFLSGFPYIWNLLVGNGLLLNRAGGLGYQRVSGNYGLNGGETGSPTSFQRGVHMENNVQPYVKENLIAAALENNQRDKKGTAQSLKDGAQMEEDNVLIEAPCAEVVTLHGLPTKTDTERDAILRNVKEGMQEMVQSTQHRCHANQKLDGKRYSYGQTKQDEEDQNRGMDVSNGPYTCGPSDGSSLKDKGVELSPVSVEVELNCVAACADGLVKKTAVAHKFTRSRRKSLMRLNENNSLKDGESGGAFSDLNAWNNGEGRLSAIDTNLGFEEVGCVKDKELSTDKQDGKSEERKESVDFLKSRCHSSNQFVNEAETLNGKTKGKVKTRLEVARNISTRSRTGADRGGAQSGRKREKVYGQNKEQHASWKRSMLPPPLPRPRVVVSKRLVSTAFGLKTSRSGRLLVPPLAHWRSQTLVHDMDGGIIAILNGSEDTSNLNAGCLNFKLPVDDGAKRLQKRLCAAATECLSNSKKACRGKNQNFKHFSR